MSNRGYHGDQCETVDCPLCGAEIYNTQRAKHLASDECDPEVA